MKAAVREQHRDRRAQRRLPQTLAALTAHLDRERAQRGRERRTEVLRQADAYSKFTKNLSEDSCPQIFARTRV